MQRGAQVIVAVEAFLVAVGHGIALVRRAYPQVAARVGEEGADVEVGSFEGETLLVLVADGAGLAVVVEQPVIGCVEQQAVFAVDMEMDDVGAGQDGMPHDTFGHGEERLCP